MRSLAATVLAFAAWGCSFSIDYQSEGLRCGPNGICPEGYTCQRSTNRCVDAFEVDPCDPNPCLNGGTCAVDGDTFTCTCAPGYSGPTCNVDPCNPNPCLNGGTCTVDASGATCACPVSHVGPTCNRKVLVRVRVGAMTGSEPITINTTSHPALFVLDTSINSAELTAVNPAVTQKFTLAGAYYPALTPNPPATSAGYISLTITPAVAKAYGSITYTTSARFASNPSSLRLQYSADSFATTLSTIALDQQRVETVNLTTVASGNAFTFHWMAANDFGENGGGEAGFSNGDIIVTE